MLLTVENAASDVASREYRYGLGVTSQFYFCSLPLRLDTYSTCAFRCTYCFAHARGGAHRDSSPSVYSSIRLAQRLDRVKMGGERDVIDEMLAHRQPIHFGGMSDPFSAFERKYGESLRLLRVLANHDYPTIISTKADLLSEDAYLDVLKSGRFLVQVSLSSMDEALLRRVDRGAPGPRRIMRMLSTLKLEGIPTACRIQPVLPDHEEQAFDVIQAAAEHGARHVSLEHLKLGLEKQWSGTTQLSEALGVNLPAYFAKRKAVRVGREWLLPVEHRIGTVVKARHQVRLRGMTFGAADSDLLLLSDGHCCCSGADLVPGFENHLRYNFAEAARRGSRGGLISIDSIADEWVPQRSVAEHVNSHSRIPSVNGVGVGMAKYFERNWNGVNNGPHPSGLHGVHDSGEVDDRGFKMFEINEEMRTLLAV